jgi:hypothetical protein
MWIKFGGNLPNFRLVLITRSGANSYKSLANVLRRA